VKSLSNFGTVFCMVQYYIYSTVETSNHGISFNSERFEQFWSINRKMVEDTVENPIRFIPIRLYLVKYYRLFIILPVYTETQNFSPENSDFFND